jgi:Uma2 family endonuclease
MAVQTPQIGAVERHWPPPEGHWTYEDYKRLPNDNWRYEVIEGELCMSPAPRTKHQLASIRLAAALLNFAQGVGQVLTAPIDVRPDELASPVQPDILFIRRERLDIIKEEWIEGAPDLIVEILLPSNWLDDRRAKYQVYEKSGVREYWIVEPDRRQIEVFTLRMPGGDYELIGRFGPGEQVQSRVIAGFEIGVDEVCPQ